MFQKVYAHTHTKKKNAKHTSISAPHACNFCYLLMFSRCYFVFFSHQIARTHNSFPPRRLCGSGGGKLRGRYISIRRRGDDGLRPVAVIYSKSVCTPTRRERLVNPAGITSGVASARRLGKIPDSCFKKSSALMPSQISP